MVEKKNLRGEGKLADSSLVSPMPPYRLSWAACCGRRLANSRNFFSYVINDGGGGRRQKKVATKVENEEDRFLIFQGPLLPTPLPPADEDGN